MITTEELSAINKNLRNAYPGQDNNLAIMIENLHPDLLSYLLCLCNAILSENNYPLSSLLSTDQLRCPMFLVNDSKKSLINVYSGSLNQTTFFRPFNMVSERGITPPKPY